MGYEFKFKESEERMKLLYTLGALVLLSTSATAQELSPVLPLPVEPVPEVNNHQHQRLRQHRGDK